MAVLKYPESSDSQSIHLPIVCTKTIEPELIEVAVSKGLDGLGAKVDVTAGTVELSMDSSFLDGRRRTRTVTIENLHSGSTDQIPVVIEPAKAVDFFPSIVRLYPSNNDALCGKVIVRANSTHSPGSACVVTKATINNHSIKCESKTLAPGTFQLSICVPAKTAQSSDGKGHLGTLRLQMNVDGQQINKELRFRSYYAK